jgi:hypothetical protein
MTGNEIIPVLVGVALVLGWLMLTVSTLGPAVAGGARTAVAATGRRFRRIRIFRHGERRTPLPAAR